MLRRWKLNLTTGFKGGSRRGQKERTEKTHRHMCALDWQQSGPPHMDPLNSQIWKLKVQVPPNLSASSHGLCFEDKVGFAAPQWLSLQKAVFSCELFALVVSYLFHKTKLSIHRTTKSCQMAIRLYLYTSFIQISHLMLKGTSHCIVTYTQDDILMSWWPLWITKIWSLCVELLDCNNSTAFLE